MTKIKVLEIIGDSTLAGAPRHLLSLLRNFDYRRFTPFVICPPGPLAGEVRTLKKSLDLEIVPMHTKYDIGAIREIRANIKHLKPDVIHIHGTRAGVLGRLASIGLGIPVVYTEHLWTKEYKMPGRIAHRVQLVGLWFLDMFTNKTIAVSQAVKDFLVENQISRPEKIDVVYNAIYLPKKEAKPFADKDKILLGTVGTLNEQKGMQYLIQAMPLILREFPATQLEIVGEGSFKRSLEKLVRKLKLSSKVKLVGFISDVEEELEKFDVYVQPSLSESFGLAILEAMGLGLPIVATNTGGIPEVVTAEKTGILVEAKNPRALAKGIIELLRDKEKSKKMGKMAREDAKIKFDLDDMIEQTEKIYENLVPART